MRGRLLTAEEYGKMETPLDKRDELVRGEIVYRSLPRAEHGLVSANFCLLLGNYCDKKKRGYPTWSIGLITERTPDTVRGPDLTFWSHERFPGFINEYPEIMPDLVIEILDDDEVHNDYSDKVREYLAAGTRLVWVVDPDSRTVMVYAGTMRGLELDEAETIDGGDVLPGFSCLVSAFFD
jgi:Uma2 family endonuclease